MSPTHEQRAEEARVVDPHRGVVLLAAGLAAAGTVASFLGYSSLEVPVLLEAAATLVMATGALLAVAVMQDVRARGEDAPAEPGGPAPAASTPPVAATQPGPVAAPPAAVAGNEPGPAPPPAAPPVAETELRWPGPAGTTLVVVAGLAGLVTLSFRSPAPTGGSPLGLTSAAALAYLASAGLAALVARYFAEIDARRLPEALALSRGARLVSGVQVLAAASLWLAWADQPEVETLLFFLVLALNSGLVLSVGYGLWSGRLEDTEAKTLRLDALLLELLGSRANPLASLLDSAERRLGVDLRSTWALLVVRRSVEPLIVALAAVGWLSTSLTRVGLDEQAVVERFGVRVGEPLGPGLHLHWPWPVSTVIRKHVLRVNGLTIGHEGEEEKTGPENVLWAVRHAENEFVLVLGNGRDLITIDGDLQYRIKDIDAWEYHWRDPEGMLLALAYRAVMRSTVDKTLSEALSQNIARLTAQMRTEVQVEADALGLGVEVVTFTLGGMHPPVPVSQAYQGVVSAELGRITASVTAQSYLKKVVPAAEASAIEAVDGAKAGAAAAAASAAGTAWSFRALESEYRASPEEYRFRRRLEALEAALHGQKATIIDRRIERDGGALWFKE
ncbi:MAG TPA: SPFH domain-containing protein [Planctomycetota bacterium]|nr:SPFH domain-containing protein [Planctomycetota bacterium]